jgi:hypothetical protein
MLSVSLSTLRVPFPVLASERFLNNMLNCWREGRRGVVYVSYYVSADVLAKNRPCGRPLRSLPTSTTFAIFLGGNAA